MAYPTPRQVALLIAVTLKRAEKTRARMSEKTVKMLSSRSSLRDAYVFSLRQSLEDYGVLLVRLDRGGFALVAISALEGAPTVLARDHVTEERRALKAGELNEDALLVELGITEEESED